MKKNEIEVLIVDDDITALKVMEGAVKKLGYNPRVAKNVTEAMSLVRMVPFHAAVIDCMLPQKNGVDLAEDFRETRFANQPIFLMSGIFKDRSFSDEAVRRSKAKGFFKKPLDLDEFGKALDESLEPLISEDTVPLHKLISKGYESSRERRKAIELLEEISGYDLPFVLSVLMDAKVGGHLNIINDAGEIFGISMCRGLITRVDSPDSAGTLAINLIQEGFITKDDLADLGEKAMKGDLLKTLLAEALISPHSVPDIRMQQTLVEIENLIGPNRVQFNFVPERIKDDVPGVSLDQMMPLFNKLTESVISIDYIKDFYKDWGEFPILKGPQYSSEIRFGEYSVLKRTPDIHQSAEQQFTINELVETRAFDVDQVYRSIHVLTLRRIIIFDTEKKGLASKNLAEKVEHVYAKVEHLGPEELFRYFGASDEINIDEVQKIYKEFAKTNHPDKMIGVSPKIKEVATSLFSKVSEAHDLLGNEESRKKYYHDIKQKAAKKQIESEELMQKARVQLKKNSFEQAYDNLSKAYQLYKGRDVTLYYLWSRLKVTSMNTPENLIETDKILKGFDVEDRRTALYQFVLGLSKKAKNDIMGASACFDKAMQYDPNFLDARRESVLLQSMPMPNAPLTGKDLLNADLGELVGNLFKKKK